MIKVMNKNLVKSKIINNTIERHPVKILGEDYKVKIIYKNVKVAQLDVEEKVIKVTLQNKYKKINNNQMLDFAINKMYEAIAKVEIERAMEKTRIMLKFAPENYIITNLNNSLAKCENNNIIIDPKIVMFDKKIIDYIVLHEYCHLKYKTHSKGFMKIIQKYEPNYKIYDNEIKNYKI